MPRPSPRTKWTRRVPHPVLSGHAASLTPKMTALTLLDVGSNLLGALPDAVGRLYALTELLAFRNELSTLPASLQFLTSLRVLDVSRNEITRLPDVFDRLRPASPARAPAHPPATSRFLDCLDYPVDRRSGEREGASVVRLIPSVLCAQSQDVESAQVPPGGTTAVDRRAPHLSRRDPARQVLPLLFIFTQQLLESRECATQPASMHWERGGERGRWRVGGGGGGGGGGEQA